jgi:hypothetical protein
MQHPENPRTAACVVDSARTVVSFVRGGNETFEDPRS